MTVVIICLLVLFILYKTGLIGKLISHFKYDKETVIPDDVDINFSVSESSSEETSKMNRRQLEKVAANCLYFMMTETERQNINIFMKCRDASDAELYDIIERFKNDNWLIRFGYELFHLLYFDEDNPEFEYYDPMDDY